MQSSPEILLSLAFSFLCFFFCLLLGVGRSSRHKPPGSSASDAVWRAISQMRAVQIDSDLRVLIARRRFPNSSVRTPAGRGVAVRLSPNTLGTFPNTYNPPGIAVPNYAQRKLYGSRRSRSPGEREHDAGDITNARVHAVELL